MSENYFYSSLTGQQIEDRLVGAVVCNYQQNLSAQQKEQARRNIGAGEQSSYFTIKGYVASTSQLPQMPQPGDAYGVGSSAPYDIYVYDGVNGQWVNNGPFNTGDFIEDGAVSAQKGWSSNKIVSEINNAMYRPNLLDNAYFIGGGSQQGGGQFPINQRGQASYTATDSASIINRWKMRGGTAQLVSGGLKITWDGTTSNMRFDNRIENSQKLIGEKLTLSVLADTLYSFTFVAEDGVYHNRNFGSITIALNLETAWGDNRPVQLYYKSTTPLIIKAMKLEIGGTQTLAHQENGVWVLNEIPNFQEELFKCRTSKADPSDEWANYPVEGYSPWKSVGTSYSIVASDVGKTLGAGTENTVITLTSEVFSALPDGAEIAIMARRTIADVNLRITVPSGIGRANIDGSATVFTTLKISRGWLSVCLKKSGGSCVFIGDAEVIS